MLLLNSDDEEEDAEMSTQPTTVPEVIVTVRGQASNKFELFERYLSFLSSTDQDLNEVLCGYFSKVFTVLVSAKTKEVFTYIYTHPVIFDHLLTHSYQKSISEILIRLLNTQENLFNENSIAYSEVNSIRTSYVHKLIQKFNNEEKGLEEHMNVCQILCEIADYKVLYTEMLS